LAFGGGELQYTNVLIYHRFSFASLYSCMTPISCLNYNMGIPSPSTYSNNPWAITTFYMDIVAGRLLEA
jgi:hypothetical protein